MNRSKLGGNWSNGVKCSSRSSNWNNSPLNLNDNNSARGVADTENMVSMVVELNSPLADYYTLSQNPLGLTAKYATTASPWVSRATENPRRRPL